MFGTGRKLSSLEERLARLEKSQANVNQLRDEIEQLKTMLVGTEADPARRMDRLLSAVGGELETKLRQALKQTSEASTLVAEIRSLREEAQGLSRPQACTAERFRGSLNHVYEARWTGYVCLYFDGGFTDSVRLLVGSENPPEECICQLNCQNDINSYAGGVIRAGEFWVAQSERKASSKPSGVRCVFTPFL